MVILRTRNKITDFLMILAWASPFNVSDDIVYKKEANNNNKSTDVFKNDSNNKG